MVKQIIRNGRATSIPLGLFYGVITSIIVTLVCSAGEAYFIHTGKLSTYSVGYIVMLNLIVSTISGCYIATVCIQRLKFIISLISGCLYVLSLLMINALFFGGIYEGTAVTVLLILGTATAVGMILGNGKIKNTVPKKRKFVKLYKKMG